MINKAIVDQSNPFRKGQPWIEWTPSLTSTGTSPTGWVKVSNASNVYRRIGDLIVGRISFTTSGTPTAGTGTWRFAPPVMWKYPTGNAYNPVIGDWYMYNNGLAAFGDAMQATNFIYMTTPVNGAMKFLGPGSITTNYTQSSSLFVTFFYEALS